TQTPATIEGFVVKAGTSAPAVRARVDLRKDGGGFAGAQSATVEASGKFVFRNLQPGTYRLSVSRDGYMQAQYGARVPGGQGTAITLQSGQAMKDIVLEMAPKGAISGRVYDRYGDPVTNASVQALTYAYQDGHRILIPADNARTNDLGEYRLFWLAPGPYIVSAIPLESPCADGCSLLLENGVSGPPQITGGTVRLDGRVAVAAPELPETHLPVYFPGTTDASAATPIDLPAGVNFTGVDLPIGEAR